MDFSDPKYANYVQLCKELRLAVAWRAGDRFGSDRIGVGIQGINVRSPQDWWIPTLAEWLEMLEAMGYDYVRIWPRGNPRSWECEVQGANAPIVTTAYSGGSVFESREEAAARLWMAVTSSTS